MMPVSMLRMSKRDIARANFVRDHTRRRIMKSTIKN